MAYWTMVHIAWITSWTRRSGATTAAAESRPRPKGRLRPSRRPYSGPDTLRSVFQQAIGPRGRRPIRSGVGLLHRVVAGEDRLGRAVGADLANIVDVQNLSQAGAGAVHATLDRADRAVADLGRLL